MDVSPDSEMIGSSRDRNVCEAKQKREAKRKKTMVLLRSRFDQAKV
jgi:hypothetical protein